MRRVVIFAIAMRAFACQALDGDRITGKDLAAANAAFSSLDPALFVAPAPMPGVVRVLRPEELVRTAQRNGLTISTPVSEICFERATEPLSAGRLQPVLDTALALDGAKVEILDFSRFGVPHGILEFNRAGLSVNGLWRGRVSFDENRSIAIWARVRVTTEQTWVEAVTPLSAGKIVETAQLRLVTGPRFPLGPAPVASIDLAAGRALLCTVKPGEPIFPYMLVAPREVERGDTVAVEVSSGAAHLSFDAVSQSSGRAGELILVKNPENGRYFQARVEGKDRVSVTK